MPDPPLLIDFDRATVHLDALQRAAYALAREMTVDIREIDGGWRCEIFPEPDSDATGLSARLRREVNDQTLRMRIAADTEPIRNLVFAVAFSRTGLVSEAGDGS